MLDNQLFESSPLAFPEMKEFLEDVELEQANQETSNPTISMANTNLAPFPESLTILQNPFEVGEISQQVEEDNNGYANQLQEQFPPSAFLSQSYPSYHTYYQHDPRSNQIVFANREDDHFFPRMITNSNRTYPELNQTSMTPPLPPLSSRSNRNQGNMQELVNQASPRFTYSNLDTYPQLRPCTNSSTLLQMMVHQNNNVDSTDANLVQERTNLQESQISITPPIPSLPSRYTRYHGNVRELVNMPWANLRYPGLSRYSQVRPCTNSFTSPQERVLGRRKRSNQNGYEHGESSSSNQRMRFILPNNNVDSTATHLLQERLQNNLYDPNYESLGLYPDPHLRKLFLQE